MFRGFKNIVMLEIKQNVRSVWFWAYTLLFAVFVAVLFVMGITESQIVGFVGLSRFMITFMQVVMVILPIYILITTVRSLVGEKEENVMEYMLSLPISFSGYFWGKYVSKFFVIFTPVFVALLGASVYGSLRALNVPWDLFALYSALIAVMVICFLGIGMYISVVSKTQNLAVSGAFIVWLVLVAFLDLILMGVMLKSDVNPEVIIGTGMLNPLQVFRTGALVLFDQKLTVMGPASYYILDTVSRPVFIVFSILQPVVIGGIFALMGSRYFRRHDIV